MSGERSLYAPLVKGAMQDGILLWRVSDGGYGKKPFDLCGIGPRGLALGIEVKASDRLVPPERLLAEHQLIWLRCYEGFGGIGLCLVYNTSTKTMVAYDYRGNVKGILCREAGLWRGWNELMARSIP